MGLKKLTPEKHLGKGMTNQEIFGEFEYAANIPRVNPWTTHAEATVRCSVEDSGEVILAFPSLCYHKNENSTPVSLRPPQSQLPKPKVVPLQIWLETRPPLKPRGAFHLVLKQNLSLPSSTVFLRFIFNEHGLC